MTSLRTSSPNLTAYSTPEHALSGSYVIERVLGSGGMATVFLARDLKHDRKVAVKVLKPELTSTVNTERFEREITLAAGLAHPHILTVHDSGSVDGLLYYVMPYVEGETLAERIEREGQLSMSNVMRIARAVASALQFAHDRGIVHRDIKPANVLLAAGVPVVADFGLARALERDSNAVRLTEAGLGVGTPVYMSPEQATGSRDVNAKADQYSLACVVFEMFTGRPPFDGGSYQRLLAQHLNEVPPSVSESRPDLPPYAAGAIARALSKDPNDRFPSVQEFVHALEGGDTSEHASRTLAAQSRWARPLTRRTAMIGVLALVAVGVVATSIWRSTVEPAAGASLDPNRVAIAPFDVLDVRDSLWRDGMVDVLSRDFDGQGPLRTVAPTTVIRAWHGRADATSAATLAKATGAGIVVLGQLVRSGTDSVRMRAMLFDAKRDSTLYEVDLVDEITRFDRLTDSLTFKMLSQLAKERPIAAVPGSTIRAHSMVALKSFLQGEQAYRRHDTTAARLAYQQAIALDTGFALAMRRMRSVTRFDEFDSVSLAWAVRAGARNRGLTPRDSLLVLADSLAGAIGGLPSRSATTAGFALLARRAEILGRASRLYPNDPEVWNDLGELRVHFGARLPGNSMEMALQAFEKAIELDPAFSSAYYHAIELAAGLRPPEVARRYALASFKYDPVGVDRPFAARLLQGKVSDREIRATVDTMDLFVARTAGMLVRMWDDRDETAARVHAAVLSHQDTLTAAGNTTLNLLARAHLRRGRIRESRRLGSAATHTPTFRDMALVGAIPAAEADSFLARRMNLTLGDAVATLPWWSARGDTAAIRRVRARLDSAAAAGGASTSPTPLVTAGVAGAAAHLALALRDTARAAQLFADLPNAYCDEACRINAIIGARLFLARRDVPAAIRLLDRHQPTANNGSLYEGLWSVERARAAERVNDAARAKLEYSIVERRWAGADPELQHFVAEARQALRRLGGTR